MFGPFLGAHVGKDLEGRHEGGVVLLLVVLQAVGVVLHAAPAEQRAVLGRDKPEIGNPKCLDKRSKQNGRKSTNKSTILGQ